MTRRSLLMLLGLLAAAVATPSQAEPVTISGEVTYRERIALPPAAQLRVRLVDLAQPGRPTVEAAGAIANPGRVPLSFTLNFDSAVISAGHDYALEADILAGDELWFTTGDPHPVEPLDGTPVAILVNFAGQIRETPPAADPAPETPATPDILNTVWRAEAIRGEAIPPNADTSLSIADDLRAGGRGGCNSYFAQVRLEGENLVFSAIAATRMACTEGTIATLEAGYFAALGATRFWRVRDDRLQLLDASGQEVVQFSRSAR
jgi:putative lipoprotein